jgi:ABC-2 type transport system permease protein
MTGAMTIFKKELKGYFQSPSYYVLATLVSVVLSWLFMSQLSKFSALLQNYVAQQDLPQQQLNIHYGLFIPHLSSLNFLLVFLVPALTMRLFADEKKLRTLDLLLTSPVTSAGIVIGKYAAALVAVGGLVFLALLYPLTTLFFTTFSWGPLLVAFLGIFLVSGCYVAMDLFCSSLTETAWIGYFASAVMNLSIWFISIGADMTDNQTVHQIFEHISMNTHLASLAEGTIRSSSLVFLASLMALFCFLCERVVESARWR